MMLIEPDGLIVLCIDDKCVDGNLGAERPQRGIPQQTCSELPSTISLIDRKAT
jgi:hypothetical protein